MYPSRLCSQNTLKYSNICSHHCIGHKVAFIDAVNNFASILQKAISEYEKLYSFELLCKAAAETKVRTVDGLYMLYNTLEDARCASENDDPLTFWGYTELDTPINCKGTFISKIRR